jgi:prefoldin subunit 5
MGKLDLLVLKEKIEQAKQEARKRKDAARKANAEYAALREELQPQIDEMSEIADKLAQEFRRLYREAQDAYAMKRGADAKAFSQRGRMIESKCKELNGQISELREELKEAYQKYKELYGEAEEYELKAKEYENDARALRNVPVEGFTGNGLMSDTEVENFLNEFPLAVFSKITEISYFNEVHIEEDGKRCLGKTISMVEASAMPMIDDAEIAIYRNDSKPQLKHTIAHEIGHAVFLGFMDGLQRRRWGELYEARRKMGKEGLVTDYAGTSVEEGFSEWFASFKLEPEELKKFDEKGYTFINSLHRSLQDL